MINDGAPECGVGEPATSLAAVAAVVDEAGASGRRLREVIANLAGASKPLEELIRSTAVPRRTVEALLMAADGDIERGPQGFTLRSDRVPAYRERFGLARLESTRLSELTDRRLTEYRKLVAQVGKDIAAAPGSREALDQVSATAETVVRRALWLEGTFDLAGRRLLCIGDHDLTSLAMCVVNPDVVVRVVDIDDRFLEFIDRSATARGLRVQCRYADFRLGFPADTMDWADVVLTDPPYTPDGVQLFLGRGLQGLRDKTGGRLVMAYGFGDRAPALGVKVQRAAQDLELAFAAILPGFNRYHGAQAVGSASDLYVCQPTTRTWNVLERRLEQAAMNIYTHGGQSLEGQRKQPSAVEWDAVRDAAVRGLANGASAITVTAQQTDGRNITLNRLLARGLPAQWTHQPPATVAVDLSADPGPWLLRCLLATNADRMAIVVPNAHADVDNESGQHALAGLVAAKYSLRFRRSSPGPRLAIVEAVAVEPASLDAGRRLVRRLLDRAHGKIGNVWREGLISVSRRGDAVLTKNDARTLTHDTTVHPEILNSSVIDLPRHVLPDLFAEVAASAQDIARGEGA